MKTSNHSVALKINATPETVWDIISSGENADKWLAPITTCKVEGDKRYCSTEDGSFEEAILEVNHQDKTFSYFIATQHMLPIKDITGKKMQVMSVDENTALVNWSWEYTVENTDDKMVKEALNGVGQVRIKGTKAFANSLVH